MDIEQIKPLEGKRVKIFLKNERYYTATILKIENKTITVKDKYGDKFPIDCEMIGVIELLKEGKNELGGRFG